MSEIDKEKEDYVPFDELDVEFGDFIGHFKNCIGGESLQHFFNVWEHAEEAGHTYGRDTGKIEKADKSLNLGFNFIYTLRYLNNTILPKYMEEYNMVQGDTILTLDGKIQKTLPSQGYHGWHYEHCGDTPNRCLAWTLYLNDVEEGGETEFLYQSRRYTPRTGDILIWPAGHTHMHRGNPPLSGEKYIATGWYEYVQQAFFTEGRNWGH